MIRFKNVCKIYDNTETLRNIDFEIAKGEFVALIGEGGAGKTVLLKMINRLIEPTQGKIYINNQDITNQDILQLRRNIGYVVQEPGLFPHLTLLENISLVPYLKGHSEQQRTKRAYELLELIGFTPPEEYAERMPASFTYGEQQMMEVVRALAADPEIVLMDEPFSALDPLTRKNLQDELLNIQRQLHKTIVFVTHDIQEAFKLADRVAILKNGEILQYDTVQNICDNPKNQYIHFFLANALERE